MGCTCAFRCIIGLVNTLIAIAAAVVTIVGGLLAWGYQAVQDLLNKFVFHDTSIDENMEQIRQMTYKLLELTAPLGIILFAIGLTVFLICLFGIIGACCESRCMMTIYLTLHTILLLAEIILIIIYFARPDLATKWGYDLLNQTVTNYVSVSSTDLNSAFLNVIMPVMKCCGVQNGTDFANSPKFERTQTYNGQTYTLSYPIPCCMFTDDLKLVNNGCPSYFNVQNSNINKGCWPVAEKLIHSNMNLVAYIAIGVVLFQGLLLLLTAGIVCTNPQVKPI